MFAELSEDILSPAARDTRDDAGGASGGGKVEGILAPSDRGGGDEGHQAPVTRDLDIRRPGA
jgi:hypothetical protein